MLQNLPLGFKSKTLDHSSTHEYGNLLWQQVERHHQPLLCRVNIQLSLILLSHLPHHPLPPCISYLSLGYAPIQSGSLFICLLLLWLCLHFCHLCLGQEPLLMCCLHSRFIIWQPTHVHDWEVKGNFAHGCSILLLRGFGMGQAHVELSCYPGLILYVLQDLLSH